MANLKDLIVQGPSRFIGEAKGTKFVTDGGTSSQFVKGDGTLDDTNYAPLASPSLTGTPTAPTAAASTNSTQIATTAFVKTAVSGKEDMTAVVAAAQVVTTLAVEVGKYYRLDAAIGTLAVTLPEMTDTSVVRTVVLFLTAGTTPAVTFTTADSKSIYYAAGFEIEAGGTYEINALFNGTAWVIASVLIVKE